MALGRGKRRTEAAGGDPRRLRFAYDESAERWARSEPHQAVIGATDSVPWSGRGARVSPQIPEAARQLGVRLRIATFDARDRAAFLEQLGEAQLPAIGSFLDRDTVVRWTRLTQEAPDVAARLQSYRQTFYWLLRPGRNLTALPTTLRGAAKGGGRS